MLVALVVAGAFLLVRMRVRALAQSSFPLSPLSPPSPPIGAVSCGPQSSFSRLSPAGGRRESSLPLVAGCVLCGYQNSDGSVPPYFGKQLSG